MADGNGTAHSFSVNPGDQFNHWTAITHVSGRKSKAMWSCRCRCGTMRDVICRDLFNNKSKSCGCTKGDAQRINLTGQPFGSLTVISHHHLNKWNCECECGARVLVIGKNLRTGNTTTCGSPTHQLDEIVDARIEAQEKTCCGCGETKEFSAFPEKRSNRDGRGSHCRSCNRVKCKLRRDRKLPSDAAAKAKWRQSHVTHLRQKSREWYADHRDEIARIRKESSTYQDAKRRDNHRGKQKIARRSKMICKGVQLRCKQRGIDFDLTPEFVESRLRSGCERTGIQFDFAGGRGPFSPSVDRVRPGEGYTQDNVQIVVWCYNAAKGDWSHDDVVRMAKAVLRQEKKHGRSGVCPDSSDTNQSPKRRQRRIEFVA